MKAVKTNCADYHALYDSVNSAPRRADLNVGPSILARSRSTCCYEEGRGADSRIREMPMTERSREECESPQSCGAAAINRVGSAKGVSSL